MLHTRKRSASLALAIALAMTSLCAARADAGVVTPEDALGVRRAGETAISPDGAWIAYTVSAPRAAGEEAGGAWSELYLVSTLTGEIRPFITGKVDIHSPAFSPDGALLAFTTQRGTGAKTQVWAIPIDGGEAFPLTKSKTGVRSFRWHPDGRRIGYLALEEAPAVEKQ
ncbi:MAG: hypothetical protein PHQ19_05945, partial [Candidatus Krumholzibacteria bacterium]|nr:hypothetical protein [Candidatus Krumholzibacteria bacterium]